MGIRKISDNKSFEVLLWYGCLFLCSIIFLVPLLWMLSASFKTPQQSAVYPPVMIPDPITIRAFVEGFRAGPFLMYFKNSLTIAVFGIFGTLLSSSLVGFGFARLKARSKNFLFIVLLSTMMIPGTVTLIPIYVLYSKLGWINTFLPLIVPTFLGGSAFYIFLLRQFFITMPKELEEAAKIDGCSLLKVFYSIFIPNAKPALVAVVIFQFVFLWNDFFSPMIFLIDVKKYTIAVGLAFFRTQYAALLDMGPLMAMSLITVSPVVLVYIIAQKYFVQGIVTTGFK